MIKRHKKPATVWLARADQENYEIGTKKSGWNAEPEIKGFADKSYVASFCAEEFERVTGIWLDLGEAPVKVRINVEVTK